MDMLLHRMMHNDIKSNKVLLNYVGLAEIQPTKRFDLANIKFTIHPQ